MDLHQPHAAASGGDAQNKDETNGSDAAARLLASVARALGPLTVATAVLYYYGWTRTNAMFREFGVDVTVLSYTTQDYLFRGVATLIEPVRMLATVGLLAVGLHVLVSGLAKSRLSRLHTHAHAWMAAGLLVLGLGLWTGSELILHATAWASFEYVWYPTTWTVGVAISAYACWLGSSCLAVRTADEQLAPVGSLVPAGAKRLGAVFLSLMLLLGGSWALADYGDLLARELARSIRANPSQRPAVVVYSRTPLDLSAPGVELARGAAGDQGYPYRYSGLRLLTRSGSRYFLIPAAPSASAPVILLEESDSLRFEFGW